MCESSRTVMARVITADAAGAQVAGGLALGTSLLEVAGTAYAWSVSRARLSQEPNDPPSAGQAIAWQTANRLDAPVPPDWHAADRLPHPIDSHPPLVQRLERLGTAIELAWRAALTPNRPSASLLPQAAEIDRRLTDRISELAHLIRSKARTSDKKSENDRSASAARAGQAGLPAPEHGAPHANPISRRDTEGTLAFWSNKRRGKPAQRTMLRGFSSSVTPPTSVPPARSRHDSICSARYSRIRLTGVEEWRSVGIAVPQNPMIS